MYIIWISMGLLILQEHTDYNTENLDERFILKLLGSKEDNMFESLLYKSKACNLNHIYSWAQLKYIMLKWLWSHFIDVFMKFNNETGMLTMNYSKRQGPTYLFQTFRTRGPQSTVSDTNGGDLFVFERIIEN